MNLKEFAALKVGDKIDNHMLHSHGTVTEVNDQGIMLCWHPGTPARAYSVNTTAWMHWSKAEDGGAQDA